MREIVLAHSELTNTIYAIVGREKIDITEQAIAEVKAIQALEQESCDDAISRQAVLDLVNSDWKYEGLESDIEDLPPVKPQEPKIEWIPVSERLPEDGRPVLIYAWNVHHVIARYDEFRTENGYKKTWVTADAWNGNTEIKHEVIAWQPLPEPYREG